MWSLRNESEVLRTDIVWPPSVEYVSYCLVLVGAMRVPQMTDGDEHLFVFFDMRVPFSVKWLVIAIVTPPLVYNWGCVRNCSEHTHHLITKQPYEAGAIINLFSWMLPISFPIVFFVLTPNSFCFSWVSLTPPWQAGGESAPSCQRRWVSRSPLCLS